MSRKRGRRRYGDVGGVGRSDLVPFIPGEKPMERHDRRLVTNCQYVDDVEAECKRIGVDLKIHNGSHHWRFKKGAQEADWWPSSAKMVFNQKWSSGLHVYDVQQALREIKRRWGETPLRPADIQYPWVVLFEKGVRMAVPADAATDAAGAKEFAIDRLLECLPPGTSRDTVIRPIAAVVVPPWDWRRVMNDDPTTIEEFNADQRREAGDHGAPGVRQEAPSRDPDDCRAGDGPEAHR